MRSVSAEQAKLYSKPTALGPTDDTGQAQLPGCHTRQDEGDRAGEGRLLLAFDEHAAEADILDRPLDRIATGADTRDAEVDGNSMVLALVSHDRSSTVGAICA